MDTGSNPVYSTQKAQYLLGLFFFLCNRKVLLLHKKALLAGGALRAKEVWPLKQPRSGARLRLAGLFILWVYRVPIFCGSQLRISDERLIR